jgi:hypothetical protein
MTQSTEERGFLYTLGETKIFVSNRPKSLFGKNSKFEADAFLSVTDTFCVAPEGKIFVWFPWNEGRYPTPEMYYACNKALAWWVFNQNLPNIQIFCDGGTHRSVTVFGAFLRTYSADLKFSASEIVNNRVAVGYEESDPDHCNPLNYIDKYLEKFPEDRLLFKVMGEDRISRLDSYCREIFQRVRGRYGENQLDS